MYVCICNNLTTKKIDKALDLGIAESKKVYSYFNCKPKCGKCIEFMNELIQERKENKACTKFEKENLVANY